MAKSMSIKLEFVAPLPQIAITRFTYNAVEFYGPQAPRYKEVDLYVESFYKAAIRHAQCYTVRKQLPALNTLNSTLVGYLSFPGSVETR